MQRNRRPPKTWTAYAELITASALNGLQGHRSLRFMQCHAEIGKMPPKRQKSEPRGAQDGFPARRFRAVCHNGSMPKREWK
jgi:hypothetical protein